MKKELAERIDFNSLRDASADARKSIIRRYLINIIKNKKILIGSDDIKIISEQIYRDSFLMGPISSFLDDDDITEIMINNYNQVYIERNGNLELTDVEFKDNAHISEIIDKVLSPLGLRIDESCPMVDARLDDGSRINVVRRPISKKDIVVSIRKFKKSLIGINELINRGSLSEEVADFLKKCVKRKTSILISGGTSTGKTTMLNILSGFIGKDERIITIEDTLELKLELNHVIELESRLPNIEGRGEIRIRDLVINSLRMRPNRIIVGEIRGEEAVDVLQAMNTGHDGSMTTVHANSPLDTISRLETMILMSEMNLNPPSARRIISSSVDMIIHLERLEDGRRLISRISEVVNKDRLAGSKSLIGINDIYLFNRTENKFLFTGYIPGFIKRRKDWGFNRDDRKSS